MPCQHLPDLFSAQCFLVTLLVTLLSTSSDACGKPPWFGNMKVKDDLKTSYGAGEQVKYVCRPGYVRRSYNMSSVCGADGQWSPISKDVCPKNVCPNPHDHRKININYLNGSIEFGSQIEYFCDSGFYIIGQKIQHCIVTESGMQWSGEKPICEPILCEPPPNIENGEFFPNNIEEFGYEQKATYRCIRVSGMDELSLVGERQIYCTENHSWSAKPPECKVVKCPSPVIENGKQTSGFGIKYSYKATIMFECNPGFYLQGSNTVVCEANSTWQPPIPVCRREKPPPTPGPPTTTSITSISRPPTTTSITGISRPPTTTSITGISRPPTTTSITGISRPPTTTSITGISSPPTTTSITGISHPPTTTSIASISRPNKHPNKHHNKGTSLDFGDSNGWIISLIIMATLEFQ